MLNKIFQKLANNYQFNSFANKIRRKRFKYFLNVISFLHNQKKNKIRILDIGGTQKFWEMMQAVNLPIEIVILNLFKEDVKYNNIISVVGDAINLSQFKDREFDIVFSNSVIEHLSNLENQKLMANEVLRVGHNFFIQTPNYFFPIEPHFGFPFFHFLPRNVRIFLLMNFSLGWYKKTKNADEAAKLVDEINLLRFEELKNLFPNSFVIREKIFGLTKSFVVVNQQVKEIIFNG